MFGEGWDLLIPYRIKPHSDATREFANAVIPTRMVVKNIVTGQTEILTFDTERYTAAGYVPYDLSASQLAGLFIMSDATFRLVDKLGNEFWFDGAGRMNAMRLGADYDIDIEYATKAPSIAGSPYRVMRSGSANVEFRGVILPTRMKLLDLNSGWSEVLEFSTEGTLAGYVPTRDAGSRTEILALLSDGSFQLLDRNGNEFAFDAGGRFEELVSIGNEDLVASISHGDRRIEFGHVLGRSGSLVTQTAKVLDPDFDRPLVTVEYDYSATGLLASAERTGRSRMIP